MRKAVFFKEPLQYINSRFFVIKSNQSIFSSPRGRRSNVDSKIIIMISTNFFLLCTNGSKITKSDSSTHFRQLSDINNVKRTKIHCVVPVVLPIKSIFCVYCIQYKILTINMLGTVYCMHLHQPTNCIIRKVETKYFLL